MAHVDDALLIMFVISFKWILFTETDGSEEACLHAKRVVSASKECESTSQGEQEQRDDIRVRYSW